MTRPNVFFLASLMPHTSHTIADGTGRLARVLKSNLYYIDPPQRAFQMLEQMAVKISKPYPSYSLTYIDSVSLCLVT